MHIGLLLLPLIITFIIAVPLIYCYSTVSEDYPWARIRKFVYGIVFSIIPFFSLSCLLNISNAIDMNFKTYAFQRYCSEAIELLKNKELSNSFIIQKLTEYSPGLPYQNLAGSFHFYLYLFFVLFFIFELILVFLLFRDYPNKKRHRLPFFTESLSLLFFWFLHIIIFYIGEPYAAWDMNHFYTNNFLPIRKTIISKLDDPAVLNSRDQLISWLESEKKEIEDEH